MNFYSKLLYSNDTCLNDEDLSAVYSMYNSLHQIEEEKAQYACMKFLNSFLEYITFCCKIDPNLRRNGEFQKICSEWQKSEFESLYPKKHINFNALKPRLVNSFSFLIEVLKGKQAFVEPKKEEAQIKKPVFMPKRGKKSAHHK